MATPITRTAKANALLIKLSARPDFSAIEKLPRGPERKQAAYDAVVATAKSSQGAYVELAEQLKNEGAITGYQTLVSPNMLVVEPKVGSGTATLAAKFQALGGVKAIYSNSNGQVLFPKPGITDDPTPIGPGRGLDVDPKSFQLVSTPVERPYGVDMVGAPEAWAAGADGTGLVFGSIDTGADATHEAIAAGYRGTNADGTRSDDYNWFDPTGQFTEPKDDHGHGTHTIGTATSPTVGVARGAKWISARGLAGEVDGTLRSLQWMLAPTKVDGTAPDPTKAPDVVGMSWYTGLASEDLFLENIQDLRAAGIEPIKSAGNNGPRAGSISSPGQFPELISTAAVNSTGAIASFSSRGPAPYPKGSTTPKPDFAAPGVDVVSSMPGNKYGKMSGTSMAQPHMAGVVLSVLSKFPQLSHDQLMDALKAGAKDGGAAGFDPEFGWGLVNLPATLAAAQQIVAGAAAVQTPAAA